MVRRTITMPENVERLVRELAAEGESFSAAVSRLLEQAAAAGAGPPPPPYVGAGEGPADLGERAEAYLSELADSR
jgi:hypothetical protein